MSHDVFALEEMVLVEEHWDFVDVESWILVDFEVLQGLLYTQD